MSARGPSLPRVKIFRALRAQGLMTLGMRDNPWARLLTYVTGLVNQELLLQNEYLAAENTILKAHLAERLRLSDPERATLAEIGKRLGRKALGQVGLRGQTRHYPGMVPEADRSQVRRLQAPQVSR